MSTVVGQTAGHRRPERRIGAAAAGVDAISKTRTTRFIGLAVAVVVGLSGSLAISATPAAAAVPGLIRVSSISGSTPHDSKVMVVACPAGKKLVGSGARITGGLGEVVLTSLQPNGSPTVAPTSVTAIAQEADPISRNWSLTVYGICANPLPGLVRISATSVDNQSEDFKGAAAVCPTGKRMVSSGFSIGLAQGQATVRSVLPVGTAPGDPVPYYASVAAAESDLYSGNWSLIAYAICATAPAGLQSYFASSARNSADKSVVAQCPAGKAMLGAGLSNGGPVGQIVLDDYVPSGGPTTAPTSILVTEYEEDAVAEDWDFVAYAICANR
jgi:hypothetical protein